MSQARDEIVAVLTEHVGCRLSADHIQRMSYQLMPIVVRTVARGLEKAASELEAIPWADNPSDHLRGWATEARAAANNEPMGG